MTLLEEATKLFSYTSGVRRKLHQNPELSFEEYETAAFIAEELSRLGFQVQTKVGKTGVLGLLETNKPGPVFLLRFDMDALPMQEENDAPYRSQNNGRMHACGHDSHVALGLTVATLLREHLAELKGTYKLAFQPAEEIGQGANAMIADGVLENPKPDFALGMHVWNDEAVGWFGISSGPIMAGSEMFIIDITGKGGHGASPQLAVDPIIASAQIISALQSVVSRNVSPTESAVVSVTSIHGGTAGNIIPPAVELKGTIRSFTPEIRQLVIRRFEEIVNTVAQAMGCEAHITLQQTTIPVVNDAKVTLAAQNALKKLDASAQLVQKYQTMGSEDMAYFLERVPGCFIFVGSANKEKGLDFPHHHPRFDIDESGLPLASALMVQTCLDLSEGVG